MVAPNPLWLPDTIWQCSGSVVELATNANHYRARDFCYTIGDNWTFIPGIVSDFEADYLVIQLEFSPEYFQRLQAETILKILKFIVKGENNPI